MQKIKRTTKQRKRMKRKTRAMPRKKIVSKDPCFLLTTLDDVKEHPEMEHYVIIPIKPSEIDQVNLHELYYTYPGIGFKCYEPATPDIIEEFKRENKTYKFFGIQNIGKAIVHENYFLPTVRFFYKRKNPHERNFVTEINLDTQTVHHIIEKPNI
jgi:hypothetical protein